MREEQKCGYVMEEDRVVKWAKERGYSCLLLQAPDGIKRCLKRVIERLEEEGVTPLISGSHCWGGCDVAVREAVTVGADGIVHFGHHGPVGFHAPDNVLFIPAYSKVDVARVVEKAAAKLEEEGVKRVALVTCVQHANSVRIMRKVLNDYGITVETSRGRTPEIPECVITGCDLKAAVNLKGRADVFLVVAGGVFHGLGVAFATGGKVLVADPYVGRVVNLDREVRKTLAVRLAHLAAVEEAREAVIVLSVKPGQSAGLKIAKRVEEYLRERGIRTRRIVFDDVSRGILEDYGSADLYVNLACPRLATDDADLFPGPVVNPGELALLFEKGLENYTLEAVFQGFTLFRKRA